LLVSRAAGPVKQEVGGHSLQEALLPLHSETKEFVKRGHSPSVSRAEGRVPVSVISRSHVIDLLIPLAYLIPEKLEESL